MIQRTKRAATSVKNYVEKLFLSRAVFSQYKKWSKEDRKRYHDFSKGLKGVVKQLCKNIERNHIDRVMKDLKKRYKGKISTEKLKYEMEKAAQEILDAEDSLYWTLKSSPYKEHGFKVENKKQYSSLIEELQDKEVIQLEKQEVEIFLEEPSKRDTIQLEQEEVSIFIEDTRPKLNIGALSTEEKEQQILKSIRESQAKEFSRNR